MVRNSIFHPAVPTVPFPYFSIFRRLQSGYTGLLKTYQKCNIIICTVYILIEDEYMLNYKIQTSLQLLKQKVLLSLTTSTDRKRHFNNVKIIHFGNKVNIY